MEKVFMLSGAAGQGVQKMGQYLAMAACEEGREVTYYPVLSGNRRGGLTFCYVIVADHTIGAPERGKAHCLMLMDAASAAAFPDACLPGGDVIVNSSLVRGEYPAKGAAVAWKTRKAPLSDIALKEVGDARTISVVGFGCIVGLTGIVSEESAEKALTKDFPDPAVLELNKKALRLGIARIKES